MIEKALAAVVLVICLALLVRMVLPAAQRRRVDRAAQHAWWRLRYAGNRIRHWRRVKRADAMREAKEAIERAQRKRTLH
ncbi:MAG: hypothetical protein U1E89_00320 [Burkholderiaceae bacterium]